MQWYITNLINTSEKNENFKRIIDKFEDIFDNCPYHSDLETLEIFVENFKLPLYDFRPKTHNKSPPIYFIEQLAKYSTNYNTNHTTELHSILYNKFSTSIYNINLIVF